MATETPLHIVGLKVENWMTLKAVSITPDGAVVKITGKNGAGKTSVMSSIESGFGGKEAFPDVPVRKGAKQADITIDLGEMVAHRKVTATGQTFTLVGKDGENIRSPQAVMDSMRTKLACDPILFMRLKPSEQRDIVSRMSGVDGEKFKARKETVFKKRTDVNRDEKAAATKVDQLRDALAKRLAEANLKSPPKDPVKVSQLVEELKKADDFNNSIVESNRLIREAEIEAKRVERLYADGEAAIKELEARIEHERSKLKVLKVDGEKAHATLDKLKKAAETIKPIDTAPIKQQIASAEGINNAGRANAELLKAVDEHQKLTKESESLTAQIQKIEEEYDAAMSAAKMPIDSLAFDDVGVTFKGVPLGQASAAEQLRVSAAIAMSGSHRLRVMLIRDGSLLDEDSMALLGKVAEENNYQLWVEVVDHGGEAGVRIVDGEAANAAGEDA